MRPCLNNKKLDQEIIFPDKRLVNIFLLFSRLSILLILIFFKTVLYDSGWLGTGHVTQVMTCRWSFSLGLQAPKQPHRDVLLIINAQPIA